MVKIGLKPNNLIIEEKFMPELPEVETVRRGLIAHVIGRQIVSVEVKLARLITMTAPDEFVQLIVNETITDIERRGKYLMFWLSGEKVLVVHLRMTGRLLFRRAEQELDPYTKIQFHLDTGDRLVFADVRTLGTLTVLPAQKLSNIHGLATMGPEPLSPDLTAAYLLAVLKNRKSNIKTLLLNQQIVGGLGNIYVDECLALAGIHPERLGNSLTSVEVEQLITAINTVIDEAITNQGTTFRDYRDSDGRKGSHQHHLLVYGRKGEPCKHCGTPISRIELGGRGTHFCANCQH